jgi:hypothetical protein
VSEIQSVEGRPLKKGMSPGRRSALAALTLLVAAIAIFVVGQLLQPAAIPADHALALLQVDGRVALAKADGSALVPLTGSGVPTGANGLLWAPGGEFIALGTRDAVVVVDRAGVVAWRHVVPDRFATFEWSPDGSRISIFDSAGGVSSDGSARASLQILNSAGVLDWDVPLPDDLAVVPGFTNLAWSPDGALLAFTGFTTPGLISGFQPTSLWVADLARQSLKQLPLESTAFLSSPAWVSDGRLYVAHSKSGETGIWRIDPLSGESTDVVRRDIDSCAPNAPCFFQGIGPIVASPDGSAIAFRDATRDISILGIASGALASVPNTETVFLTPYEWTEDGASLLYIAPAPLPADPSVPQDLTRFDTRTKAAQVVLTGVSFFDLLHAGP